MIWQLIKYTPDFGLTVQEIAFQSIPVIGIDFGSQTNLPALRIQVFRVQNSALIQDNHFNVSAPGLNSTEFTLILA